MKIYTIKVIVALSVLFTACTRVDVCEDALHPHKASVSVNYSWDKVATPLDSMVLISYRPVEDWKCAYMCSPVTAEGRYIFNRPEWLSSDSDELSVRCGELLFITFNYDKNPFSYHNIESAEAVSKNEVGVSQKTYSLDNHPEEYARDWKNLNDYAPYVLQSEDIVYQKIGPIGVPSDKFALNFEPRSIMKDISVAVEIINDGVEIEKVVGELSGICYSFNCIAEVSEIFLVGSYL